MDNPPLIKLFELRRIDPAKVSYIFGSLSLMVYILLVFPIWIWVSAVPVTVVVGLKLAIFGVVLSVMVGVFLRLVVMGYNWISERFGGILIETREL